MQDTYKKIYIILTAILTVIGSTNNNCALNVDVPVASWRRQAECVLSTTDTYTTNKTSE